MDDRAPHSGKGRHLPVEALGVEHLCPCDQALRQIVPSHARGWIVRVQLSFGLDACDAAADETRVGCCKLDSGGKEG